MDYFTQWSAHFQRPGLSGYDKGIDTLDQDVDFDTFNDAARSILNNGEELPEARAPSPMTICSYGNLRNPSNTTTPLLEIRP